MVDLRKREHFEQMEHDDASAFLQPNVFSKDKAEELGEGFFQKIRNVLSGKKTLKQKDFQTEFNSYEIDPSARLQVLNDLLQNKNDPAKFESFLRLAFQYGKMNKNGDARIFFVLRGMDEGILSLNFLETLDGKDLKSKALRNYFLEHPASREQIRVLVEKYFSGQSSWSTTSAAGVEKFWQNEVMHSEAAVTSIQKNKTALIDHDDIASLSLGMRPEDVPELFSGEIVTKDSIKNIILGWGRFFENELSLTNGQIVFAKKMVEEFYSENFIIQFSDPEKDEIAAAIQKIESHLNSKNLKIENYNLAA